MKLANVLEKKVLELSFSYQIILCPAINLLKLLQNLLLYS